MGITDSIGGLTNQQLFSNLGGVATTIFFGVLILAFIMVVGWVVYIYFIKNNIYVEIIERIGNTWTSRFDRAFVTNKKSDKGLQYLKLFWSKTEEENPDPRYYGLKGKSRFLKLHKFGNDFIPIPVTFNSPAKINVSFEMRSRMMFLQEHKKNEQLFDYKEFWDKYGQAITVAGTLLICAFIIIITMHYADKMVSTSAGVADALKGTAERLAAYKAPAG